ncbi:MAG: hypothetical protein ABIT47_04000 [Candidatus Paceibacterota bacterium]
MKEGAPTNTSSIQQELTRASMEGNVRVPQVEVGIVAASAERCLAEEDSKHMLSALLAPIPNDDELSRRTIKANAQHTHYGVPHILTEDDVRNTQAAGNVLTLNFIAGGLGMHNRIEGWEGFNQEGVWASPDIINRAREVEIALNPETRALFHTFMLVVKNILDLPEMKEKMTERRKLYSNWEEKDSGEKGMAAQEADRLANTIIEGIKEAVLLKGDELGTKNSRDMAANIVSELRVLTRVVSSPSY